MTAPLQLVHCSACGGSHSDEAHTVEDTLGSILGKLDQAEELHGTPGSDEAVEQSRFLLRRALAEIERK
jgi:hypothetical protein